MKKYTIIFKSGVTASIKAGSIEYREHIGKINVKDDAGEEIDEYYVNFEDVAAILPQ